MSLTVAAGLSAVKEIDENVGVILKVVRKLARDKQGAGLRLSAALGIVRTSCAALDGAISSYLALGLSEEPISQGAMILFDVQGGKLIAEVQRGASGCHQIGQIYEEDLKRWFIDLFHGDTPEVQALRLAFETLGNADATMFRDMHIVAHALQASADDALNKLLAGDTKAARDEIRAQVPALLPLRQAINKVLTKIETINGEIIGAGIGA